MSGNDFWIGFLRAVAFTVELGRALCFHFGVGFSSWNFSWGHLDAGKRCGTFEFFKLNLLVVVAVFNFIVFQFRNEIHCILVGSNSFGRIDSN